jgi:hypothetical protein
MVARPEDFRFQKAEGRALEAEMQGNYTVASVNVMKLFLGASHNEQQ